MDNADNKLESGPNDLLTEPEVARILRRSTSAIKRYRLTGKLAFIQGRPVLIARADLRAFLEAEKQRVVEKDNPKPIQRPSQQQQDDAKVWARKQMLKKIMRRR